MGSSSEKWSRGEEQVDRGDLFWANGPGGPWGLGLTLITCLQCPKRNLHAVHEVHQGLP